MNSTNANAARESRPKRRTALKVTLWVIGVFVALHVIAYVAFVSSPWPGAMLVRWLFNQGSAAASKALEKHLPANVAAIKNERYDVNDPDALLDVFFSREIDKPDQASPTVVWIHGGGWLSGSKNDIANYLQILAANNFTVVGVDYSIAPGAHYPTPLKQVNVALRYLMENAKRLHVDSRFVLAGDSAGAQIAAQFANIVSAPVYASEMHIQPTLNRSQLAGVILYCGPYDLGKVKPTGFSGAFVNAMPWAYSGKKDFIDDPYFAKMSVTGFVTADFPPAFISVGNGDPLAPQSLALATTLARLGVRVDTLFFADDRQPALPHEYQFNLDSDGGKAALKRAVEFLGSLRRE